MYLCGYLLCGKGTVYTGWMVPRTPRTGAGATTVVCVRLSAVEVAQLDRQRAGFSRSTFLRHLLRLHGGGGVRDVPDPFDAADGPTP